MTSNVKLLPCPFCGGKAELTMKGNVHSTRKCIVKCTACRYQRTDAALRYGDDWLHATAIAAWNRRATTARDAEIEALRAEVRTLVRQNGEWQARVERLADAGRRVTAAFRAHGEASAMLSIADAIEAASA